MRNSALLWEGKPTKVGGLHGASAGCRVNSKGIMEVTVGCRLRKKRGRMAADGSGWKRTDLGRQRCEGSRDGCLTRPTARSSQEASRREDKGMDTRGRYEEGVGLQQARWTLWRERGRPGAPDARNERQRTHGRSGRTGLNERTLFVRKRALAVWRKRFFC